MMPNKRDNIAMIEYAADKYRIAGDYSCDYCDEYVGKDDMTWGVIEGDNFYCTCAQCHYDMTGRTK